MTDSDDDSPQLCQSTLDALHEFYKEREKRELEIAEVLKYEHKNEMPDVNFEEDWQLSQFWYDDETVENIVKGALKATEANGKIALISCPTLYKVMKERAGDRQIKLFEYDMRFAVYGTDFTPYDYKSPLAIPREMSSNFDLVIADPPFLSEECLTKTAVTIKFLSKKNILLCTGAIMGELAEKLLELKKCNFEPHHRNNLANEFWCFANFAFDSLLK
ncbi:hypothetical protein PV327_000446 [Microctonus hyperodae]|uniref:Protein-lysine N-methyltransferase PV327_000446 n=1 Tax=Microctonus hyperodae TaxID=165561 RepID=A0AA39G680_MICHY|nr:hypothetical protein PV327_000446 [Microctonus hyperodae]